MSDAPMRFALIAHDANGTHAGKHREILPDGLVKAGGLYLFAEDRVTAAQNCELILGYIA